MPGMNIRSIQTSNALERLAALMAYHERKIMETAHQERWQLHNELIRGNLV
jgi:hypothetical protein